MYKTYFRDIARHFLDLKAEDIPQDALRGIRRSLLNYAGGSLFAAAHDCCRPLVNFFEQLHPEPGAATVWGDPDGYTPAVAAFCNAARVSTLELNDGVGGSAHPGIYVWSAVLAETQRAAVETGDVLRAVLFGCEVAARMGRLSVNRVLELGLHNPGFIGGLAAASAVGLLRGLNLEQLENAFGMAASLTPLCPFVSFIEGTDTKDFYGGWGTYLGMMAAEAAQAGLTGPKAVLKGAKSLESIFQGEEGLDIPLGDPYMITNLSVKQYPACFAVNPAVNALLQLRQEHPIDPEAVDAVVLETYPYSYDLNREIGPDVNRTSGKLSLPYAAAAVLKDGALRPEAFLDQAFGDPATADLMRRVEVRRHDAYGTGEKAIRGCIATITLKDGSSLTTEFNATQNKVVWTEEMLKDRYLAQVQGALSGEETAQLYERITDLSAESSMAEITALLNRRRLITC